jgi:hypothetical protein
MGTHGGRASNNMLLAALSTGADCSQLQLAASQGYYRGSAVAAAV